MKEIKLSKDFEDYLKNLNAGHKAADWNYLGKTSDAFGSPGGSWQGKDGFKFENLKNGKHYIIRSVPESNYIVLESYFLKGMLYNMNLSSNETHLNQDNQSILLESYKMTAGKGRVKKEVVKKAFTSLGVDNNVIATINHKVPNWDSLVSSLLKWADLREQVKRNISKVSSKIDTDEDENIIPDKQIKISQMPLNQILFGPPGTGKTFYTVNKAIQIANPGFDMNQPRKAIKDEFERLVNEGQVVFTTFHQSMSYEDFIEGIKPIEPKSEQNPGDTLTYKTVDGIFKLICKKATKESTVILEEAEGTVEIDEMMLKEGYDKLVSTLPDQEKEDSEVLLQTKSGKSKFWLFKNSANSIVVKAGTKRTNMSIAFSEVSSVYFERKQPAYKSYTPVIIEKIIGDAGYKEMPVDNASKNFVLIIDEINRGNISSIFGELITLIEEDKRSGQPEALEAKLPYSKTAFSVPKNLYIIGTMNTADRSVEALDTALRRRFSFTEMPPIYDLEGLQYEFAGTSGKEILQKINKRIEKLLDRDHLIGHSYFLLNGEENIHEKLINSFYRNIIPLLQEYFFGDYAKIGAVLGSGFVLRESEDNQEIFATGFENEDFAEKDIFQIIDYREGQPGSKYVHKGMTFEKAIQLLVNLQIPKESEA